GGIDAAGESLVRGKDEEEDQNCGQRQIDQVEHGGDEVVPVGLPNLQDQHEQIAEETVDQQQQANQQAEQERRQQPAAEKNRRLDVASVRPRHVIPTAAASISGDS